MEGRMRQQHTLLFDSDDANPHRALPLLGEQKDIQYFAREPRGILNGPATTGMEFWSINPYVGCAFGCAYCYARYAHRYTAERLVPASEERAGAGRSRCASTLARLRAAHFRQTRGR
jgi:DNA repair photolyase